MKKCYKDVKMMEKVKIMEKKVEMEQNTRKLKIIWKNVNNGKKWS
jgi:hypothetical protein